jgi:hypothetical protein
VAARAQLPYEKPHDHSLKGTAMPHTVEVTLIEGKSGKVLARTVMAASSLPESFLASTTLHVGDVDWSVQSAEPPLRHQFTASGKLVLTLARIERADPQTILYSLPTINHTVPALAGQADGSEVALHEDDWRQLEFVHGGYRDIVVQELREIKTIYVEHRQNAAFTKIHVRSRLPDALSAARLEMQALARLFPEPPRRIRFNKDGARIAGGFAYALSDGGLLYGLMSPPFVQTLGLLGSGASADVPDIAVLEGLARQHGLLLVDWCGCEMGQI